MLVCMFCREGEGLTVCTVAQQIPSVELQRSKERWIPLCLAAWTKRASVRSRARRQKAGRCLCHYCILAPLREDLKIRGGLSWGVLSTVVRNNDRWVDPQQARTYSRALVPRPSLGDANDLRNTLV